MKKRKWCAFTLILVFVLTAIHVNGESTNTMSKWAEKEVKTAIDNDLVPKELQDNYLLYITRSQYVLLALRIHALSGKNITMENTQPFSDVAGHKHEQEIVKAYHAGIVYGYDDGTFRPDQFIKREEIAALIVSLLKQIMPQKEIVVNQDYHYDDGNEIGTWAKLFVDFCYENNILAGVGNNQIDPRGNATIEQSIALLYRLANNEKLLETDVYGTIKLSRHSGQDGENKGPNTYVIKQFIHHYDESTLDIIYDLSQDENIDVVGMREQSATIAI
ncbi:MAG: S-layer homology domain-containing protein, partial [Proteobacteria bacterium]|nr:S-layer homology domain-containing protein [Pseudomonadota bacterium]